MAVFRDAPKGNRSTGIVVDHLFSTFSVHLAVKMEWDSGLFFSALVIAIVAFYGLLRRVNEWIYLSSWGSMEDKYTLLPPGDLGWPFIGDMLSFFRAFKSGDPDSFISSFTSRFGQAPMYRAFLFGKPSIIVSDGETVRKVLTDERFGPRHSKSLVNLLRKRGRQGSVHEHRRVRKLIATPTASHEALSSSIDYIKEIAETSFDKWSRMDQPIEFLTEMRKAIFRVITNIIMGDDIDPKSLDQIHQEHTLLVNGMDSKAISLPGFAYHYALKARKNLVKTFEGVVSRRRMMMETKQMKSKKDMLAIMLETSDENGKNLSDEEIVDTIIIYFASGNETTAHAVTWAIMLLQEHPQFLQKAREEQEDIVKKRASPETGLNHGEVKQMKYLQKVIDETLRVVSISFVVYREAKTDVILNGYTIPKGWKVLPWLRNVHIDPENYKNPYDFNPSRWDDQNVKLGAFFPFGAGPRLCPGADLAKLTIYVFLHYFLLNYRIERTNPNCGVQYLPYTRPSHPADECLARVKKLWLYT